MRFMLLACAVLLAACDRVEPVNRAPVIYSIDGARVLHAGDSADFRCNAADPEGLPLDYSWQTDVGGLRFGWSRMVRWYAPDSSDTMHLAVTVTDDADSTDTDSTEVIVLRDTVTLVWWDGAVRGGGYAEWSDSVRAGCRIAGFSSASTDTTGSVYLTVLDDANFLQWVGHGSSVPLYRRIAYEADSFSVLVPESDRYHIVVDNTERGADYNYWLWVFSVTP